MNSRNEEVRCSSKGHVRERSSTAIIVFWFLKNKEDEVIMVLARLALAEGIFSRAGTDSVLFLSKAVETTVYVLHF